MFLSIVFMAIIMPKHNTIILKNYYKQIKNNTVLFHLPSYVHFPPKRVRVRETQSVKHSEPKNNPKWSLGKNYYTL